MVCSGVLCDADGMESKRTQKNENGKQGQQARGFKHVANTD